MSELDLGLKVAARRLLWRMGYTTRLDVALRSVPTAEGIKTQNRAQAFTDLDVLGLTIGAGFQVQSAIVDCKTSARGSTERMFWVRGVAAFFAADAVYMVREHELGDAARQLAARLGITALTSEDLTRLEDLHQTAVQLDTEPLSWLFDRSHVSETLSAFGSLDKRLRPLTEYRQFDYWVYEEHRNPLQLVEHVRSVARFLDSRNPQHLALVLDLGWLYLLTLSHAVEYVRRSQVSQPDNALQEYLLGGPLGLREKRQLSEVLSELQSSGAIPHSVDVATLPPYFPQLRELTFRVLRRPSSVLKALRQLEVASALTLGGLSDPSQHAFGEDYDQLAAKQAADVVGFLVTSADLDKGFRSRTRSMLLGEGSGGTASASEAGNGGMQPSLLDPPGADQ